MTTAFLKEEEASRRGAIFFSTGSKWVKATGRKDLLGIIHNQQGNPFCNMWDQSGLYTCLLKLTWDLNKSPEMLRTEIAGWTVEDSLTPSDQPERETL